MSLRRDWVWAHELARALNLSTATIRARIAEGSLDGAVKCPVSGRWRVPVAALATLQAGLQPPAPSGMVPDVPRQRSTTLAAVLEQFTAAQAGQLADGTLRNYKTATMWAARLGIRDDRLSEAVVATARDELLAGGLGAATANKLINRWKVAWSWARERALVATPWPAIKRLRQKRTEKGPFSEAEVAELLRWASCAASGRYLVVYWLLAETGARSSEARAIRIRDVAFRPDGLAVVLIRQVKQGTERACVVSPALSERLRREVLARPPSEPLCSVKPQPMQRLLAGWLRERGLVGVRDVHSLRRYACTRLAERKVPIEVARRLIGHESALVHLDYVRLAQFRPEVEAAQRELWRDNPEGQPSDPSSAPAEPVSPGPSPSDWSSRESHPGVAARAARAPRRPQAESAGANYDNLDSLMERGPAERAAFLAIATLESARTRVLVRLAQRWPRELLAAQEAPLGEVPMRPP